MRHFSLLAILVLLMPAVSGLGGLFDLFTDGSSNCNRPMITDATQAFTGRFQTGSDFLFPNHLKKKLLFPLTRSHVTDGEHRPAFF